MAIAIPQSEPQTLRAGDTWQWSRSLSDFPAGTWTLAYTLINAAAKITITAAADGTDHLVTVAAATTAGYAAGRYSAIGRVSSAGIVYEVFAGQIEIKPNLAAATTLDDRTHARVSLEAIEAVLQNRATKDQKSYQIAGRALERTPVPDLLKMRDYYRAEVASEEAADRINQGLGGRGRMLVRL